MEIHKYQGGIMQKLFLIICCCMLSVACTNQANVVNAEAIHDFKGESSAGQFCIDPSHPYAVVGPKSSLPPLSHAANVIGAPLPIHQS